MMMQSPLKTKELAEWLQISPATVRLWTKDDEFGQYLSTVGRGGGGRNRSFNDQDARVIAFIYALKQQGNSRDEINGTLMQLQSEGWGELPPMPASPPGVNTAVVNAETAATTIIAQRNALLREISILEERNEDLQGMLKTALSDKDTLQSELIDTKELLGELRGRLQEIEKNSISTRVWIALFIVLIVAVFLLAVYVVTLN